MTTRLTGYLGNTVQADDTYPLGMIDAQSRAGKATIKLTRNAAYDGSILVKARPVGSSGTYDTWFYTTAAGALSQAGLGAASATVTIDIGSLEFALVSSGRTVGSMTVDVSVENDV